MELLERLAGFTLDLWGHHVCWFIICLHAQRITHFIWMELTATLLVSFYPSMIFSSTFWVLIPWAEMISTQLIHLGQLKSVR